VAAVPLPSGLATTLHPMPLRCLYTDLDGTLLGKFGNLFGDAEGNFSRNQALMLEACHRAGVEVVVMSGRREAQVLSDSRLMGQTSYIYEAGCGMVIDREKTYLTGEDWVPDDDSDPAQRMVDSGIAALLFEKYEGRLEWHAPWHVGRQLSLLFRGKIDVDEANALIAEQGEAGRDLRFLDNGAIGRPMEGIEVTHAYHLVPGGASKGKAVGAHMRARGYLREECIAAGDSIEDLGTAEYVGRFFCMANGHEKDEALRGAIGAYDNVTVTEGRMGDGVYEAVVTTLAGS
jgi:phosphoglycolate phosphatase